MHVSNRHSSELKWESWYETTQVFKLTTRVSVRALFGCAAVAEAAGTRRVRDESSRTRSKCSWKNAAHGALCMVSTSCDAKQPR